MYNHKKDDIVVDTAHLRFHHRILLLVPKACMNHWFHQMRISNS
jgi:hypothetical protein